MAITLGVTESYATIAEADVYLENDTTWNAATDETKTDGLLAARYYIDIAFSCDLEDYDTVPDALKYATSLLAADYVEDETVFDSGVKLREIEVEAGDVRSKKVFSTPKGNKPKSLNTVKGVLKGLCSFTGGMINLVRA